MTPILVWDDGTVSTGSDNLEAALISREYGHDGEGFRVYAPRTNGEVAALEHKRQFSGYDDDDYGYPTHSFYLDGVPVIVLTLRIDGRA